MNENLSRFFQIYEELKNRNNQVLATATCQHHLPSLKSLLFIKKNVCNENILRGVTEEEHPPFKITKWSARSTHLPLICTIQEII